MSCTKTAKTFLTRVQLHSGPFLSEEQNFKAYISSFAVVDIIIHEREMDELELKPARPASSA